MSQPGPHRPPKMVCAGAGGAPRAHASRRCNQETSVPSFGVQGWGQTAKRRHQAKPTVLQRSQLSEAAAPETKRYLGTRTLLIQAPTTFAASLEEKGRRFTPCSISPSLSSSHQGELEPLPAVPFQSILSDLQATAFTADPSPPPLPHSENLFLSRVPLGPRYLGGQLPDALT